MSDLVVNSRLTIVESELSVTYARSGGPGGQNVNKVNSKVTLKWSPALCQRMPPAWQRRFVDRFSNRINRQGQVVIHSERYRDQPRNLADAKQKLVSMLLECQWAPKKRIATKPSKGSQRRRLDQKKRQSQKKQNRKGDFRND